MILQIKNIEKFKNKEIKNMKNLNKSKILIEAGIVVLLCIGVIWMRFWDGRNENLAIPDDSFTGVSAIESLTEDVSQLIEAETTTLSEEHQDEEISTTTEVPEEETIIILTEPVTEKIPFVEVETTEEIVLPVISEKPEPPEQPKSDIPQGGSMNEKGEAYLPGFGWIPYSGPNEGKKHSSRSTTEGIGMS
jgi:cytoskeletal protein RodZ